jgi:nitrite reductase (NO-forming)
MNRKSRNPLSTCARLCALLLLVLAPLAQAADYKPDVTYTLRTGIGEGKMIFTGVGGGIDGVVNPTLRAEPGQVVQVTLVNGDGALHDIVAPEFDAKSDQITGQGSSSVMVFEADEAGEYTYWCSVPGHRAAGMEGLIQVGEQKATTDELPSIVHDPSALPEPVGDRAPRELDFTLETVEKKARLADGTSYRFWTFNETVPGPMLRARVGDTVHVTLRNPASSTMTHSVDFHAVTGPGGGAELTQVPPGKEATFSFKALQPGIYVYHCATPMVAHHITNGMYGLAVIEPEGGLKEVDREFYVMQGELYTAQEHGTRGNLEFSVDKLLDEDAEYFTFNGAVGGLTEQQPLRANVGEDVRIFFGVGGPNATSSFHVIGEIFDRVYDEGAITDPPLTNVQTTTVAPGGATMVEFGLDVPGRYILVDHALSRMEKGLAGFLFAEGEEKPEIFREGR